MTAHPELGPLQPGARVGLVAPSGPPKPEQLEKAMDVLRGWDLEPVPGKHLLDRHPRAGYLAGTDADRAADLQDAWCDDSLDAVLCVRGGYGAVRVLDLLDVPGLAAARPKPLVGSSDITALHVFWAEELGLATWFTPMVATGAFLDDPAAAEGVRQALLAPYTGRSFTSSAAEALVPGIAQGVLTGGNLALLAMLNGARNRRPVDNTGRIGLLEDVTEEPYRIDGMLQTLLRAGWFDGLAGLALGSWSECGDLAEVRALCVELLAPLGIPLVWELGFGHGPAAQSIPLGVPATLTAGPEPQLVLE
ncbi:MAG: LD-carboxypeptidase [Arthrobacter sp.]